MHTDGNFIAYGALLLWPVVALYIYTKRPVAQATLWTILGGWLLLPVGTYFKIPLLPLVDKYSVPSLAALFGCMLLARREVRLWHGFGVAELLMLMFVLSPIPTGLMNGDVIPLPAGGALPSIGLYDAGSHAAAQAVALIPFLIGRQILRDPADNQDILRVLVVAGLLYSVPVLFEVRMSPQLHVWLYGYMQTSFLQQMRDGGYRPVVFLNHGLVVSFFMMTTVVAAATLWRLRVRMNRFSPAANVSYLGAVLVLCKSAGALVYGALLVPLVTLSRPKVMMRVALLLGCFALAYPLLRMADLVPTHVMLETAAMVSEERAGSLGTRFTQEEALLTRALERPWFGWGRWGRNRIFTEESKDFSITDGHWIITFGVLGVFGFIAEFGLLVWPIFRAASALRFTQTPNEGICLGALALIVAINVIDLLPNGWLTPWSWLLVGALLGRAEQLRHMSAYGSNASLRRNVAYRRVIGRQAKGIQSPSGGASRP